MYSHKGEIETERELVTESEIETEREDIVTRGR